MDYNKLLQDSLNIAKLFKQTLVELLPNLIGAVFIFVIGFMFASLIRTLVNRFISKLHLLIPNRSIRSKVERFFEEKAITKIIGSIFYWIIIFFFLTAATETLGLPVITTWLGGIVSYLPKILSAFLIVMAGLISGVIICDLITTAANSAGILYGNILGKLVQIAVILVTILIGLDQIGINVTLLQNLLIIISGALFLGGALAFGLGAKTSVRNILASYYLQKIYKVDDPIKIGVIKGRIIKITPFAVILDTSEGQMCIPAQEFSQESSVLLSQEGHQ